MIAIYILLGVLGIGLVWFLADLIWGKPWSIRLLYTPTFLHFVLKGPELLTDLGLLEKYGLHGHNAKLSDASDAHEVRLLLRIQRGLRQLRSYDRRSL